MAPWNSLASAASGPLSVLPAMGWPPMKRTPSGSRSLAHRSTWALVLPVSITRAWREAKQEAESIKRRYWQEIEDGKRHVDSDEGGNVRLHLSAHIDVREREYQQQETRRDNIRDRPGQ